MADGYRMEWDGDRIAALLDGDLADGLGDAAEHLLGTANELVPLDEGPLMHSGVADVDRSSLRAAVSYDTPYAVRQHEEMDYRHAPGRSAKYLEIPFHAEREVMLELMAARARRRLRT